MLTPPPVTAAIDRRPQLSGKTVASDLIERLTRKLQATVELTEALHRQLRMSKKFRSAAVAWAAAQSPDRDYWAAEVAELISTLAETPLHQPVTALLPHIRRRPGPEPRPILDCLPAAAKRNGRRQLPGSCLDHNTGPKLIRTLVSQGWTRKQIAQKMNCTTQSIYNWEHGKFHAPALLSELLAQSPNPQPYRP